jgi:hypothetical protein
MVKPLKNPEIPLSFQPSPVDTVDERHPWDVKRSSLGIRRFRRGENGELELRPSKYLSNFG